MAKFDPPFASVGGVNRTPTTDEQSDGFPCGAADKTLFNRMFGRIEAELKAIQDEGGITGTEADDTTVLQAIQALIAAATGGGDTSGYVLFTQAQARLPIFPEVTTNDGVIAVTSPSTGTVRVPASATILHRGIKPYTSAETDLTTVASKTYHLRWNPSDGFALKDLADSGYNPSTFAETDASFDSTCDDMLVSRVVTNSSNVATITNLVNKAVLRAELEGTQTFNRTPNNAYIAPFDAVTWNFARTPDVSVSAQLIDYPAGYLPRAFTGCATYLTGSRSDTTGSAAARKDRYGMAVVGEVKTGLVGSTPGVYVWGFTFQYRGIAVA